MLSFDGGSAFVGAMEERESIKWYITLSAADKCDTYSISVCVMTSVPRNKGRKIIKPLKNLLNIHNNMPMHDYLEQEVTTR